MNQADGHISYTLLDMKQSIQYFCSLNHDLDSVRFRAGYVVTEEAKVVFL